MLGPIRPGRPSPALVVAILALAAALAGTAFAEVATTAKLDKKEKKQVKKIAKKVAKKQAKQAQNAVIAAQNSADAAQNSANQALDQQGTFAYQTNATTTTTPLFEGGGLRIEASCPSGVPSIDARSLVNNSTIHIATIVNGVAHYDEGDNFDSNQTRSLAVGGFTDNVQGTFTFHNGNGVNAATVTATYLIEQDSFQGNACAAFGNVEIQ